MRLYIRITAFGLLMVLSLLMQAQSKDETTQIKKIWDRGGHNAFTDINFFKGKLYVVFREGAAHIPNMDNTGNGKIRILSSVDGEFWETAGLLELEGIDLRDPKISVTPKKRMMIVMGGSKYDKQELQGITTHVSMSDLSGKKFSIPEPIELDEQIKSDFNWLWRVTWYDKTGYGVVYQSNVDGEEGKSKAYLVKTSKGYEYELVTELDIDGNPNEATIRFLSRAEMMVVARRDGDDKMGMIGTSKAPYTEWKWEKLDFQLGGPNFEIIPIDKILIGTRVYSDEGAYTALMLGKKNEKFVEIMKLPSGGDNSYPGMLSIGGFIWMSYYSSHEGKASIYYARIPYKELN
ncbi:MAG: hypothetical protein KAI99_04520 [Cyclobacteriaceae bacterium]|nr:hypothetical protein [Cyclobacteriaceae bacterium]